MHRLSILLHKIISVRITKSLRVNTTSGQTLGYFHSLILRVIISHLPVVCHILQKLLSRGSINQYVLGVSGPLGPLTFLRVWHDNSGKGKHASWFLDKVVITDLQTNDM